MVDGFGWWGWLVVGGVGWWLMGLVGSWWVWLMVGGVGWWGWSVEMVGG